jgi:hypothetical protein
MDDAGAAVPAPTADLNVELAAAARAIQVNGPTPRTQEEFWPMLEEEIVTSDVAIICLTERQPELDMGHDFPRSRHSLVGLVCSVVFGLLGTVDLVMQLSSRTASRPSDLG